MKSLIIILFLLLTPIVINANENEVIKLHQTKSLDQMVLDQFENIEEQKIESDTEVVNSDIDQNETETTTDVVEIVIENTSSFDNTFLGSIDVNELQFFLNNTKQILSSSISDEYFIKLLSIDMQNENEINEEKFYNIVKFFYEIGEISKSYQLILSRNIENNINYSYFKKIEINYLLSTYQLNEVCSIKNNINDDFVSDNQLIEKIDIFCLVLNNQLAEADLQNSILIESQSENDIYFQTILTYIFDKNNKDEVNKLNFNNPKFKDIIFLYSAMLRIAELPLNENFLQIDSKNLSIPIILNTSSKIETRIRAANNAFENNLLSIVSLSALYQSVDFAATEFNNLEKTINAYSDNIEKSMAFLYQLTNIQIFPKERLESLINFWNFARKNNLQELAYKLSIKIMDSLEVTSEYSNYSTEIATAYIYNNNYDKSLEWIKLYENTIGVDNKSTYTRLLLDLHMSNEIERVIELITKNPDLISDLESNKNKELIYVLLTTFNSENKTSIKQNYETIYDERLIPSIYINDQIQNSIDNENFDKFLMYTASTLNNKKWTDIHPYHLKLILNGFFRYSDQDLLKNIILEILKSFEIL